MVDNQFLLNGYTKLMHQEINEELYKTTPDGIKFLAHSAFHYANLILNDDESISEPSKTREPEFYKELTGQGRY